MSEARDVMEYEVAIVGAGPAGLACAIRLKQLNPALNICVLEKAASLGAHSLSGAVLEPGPLDELLPAWRENPPDICVPATR
ncbi:MAG TPA: FAD-dependent oxidoreductase, partial [Steroidobacteraceae bacterium]|nr:FAD-dependent oxidoreductase [Steroidobacteraceae bacterium]